MAALPRSRTFRSLLIAAVISSSLMVAPSPAASADLPPGGNFIDDDGTPHEPNIEAIFAAGITAGCGGDRFCPQNAVTRGQMAAFLATALDLPATSLNPFSDTAGPCADDINRIAAAGITAGCGGDRFCPQSPVTRGEMATFLTRGLGLVPLIPTPRPLPLAGNPNGHAPIPPEGALQDTSNPDVVIGNGPAVSCTSAAVVSAIAQGGVITFDCGPEPVTIVMEATARVFNDTARDLVIDGGGLVTLSGDGQRRILYMNTCDPALVWTTSHCQNQDHPRLTIQNMTFMNGNASHLDPDGGGAIFVRGGRLTVINSRFLSNTCDTVGPDVGGASIRVLSQYDNQPVYVVNSTFGGAPGLGGSCSNGGGVSSIGVSWMIINTLFSYNDVTGYGANPAKSGSPGGGSGGAIYADGNNFTVTLIGSLIEDNHAPEGGGAVFFVSNDRSGHLVIVDSVLRRNPSDGFETLPGIFYLGDGPIQIVNSTIE